MCIRVLGIDPGTANMGFSVIEGNLREAPRLTDDFGVLTSTLDSGTVRERIDFLGQEVVKLIEDLQPTHVAIEDFTEQGKLVGKTYKEMAWLTEHLRMVSRQLGFEVAIFENFYWKKATLGIGHATKIQVQHFVGHKVVGAEKLRSLPKNKNHIWDSVGIGYCLYQTLQGVRQ